MTTKTIAACSALILIGLSSPQFLVAEDPVKENTKILLRQDWKAGSQARRHSELVFEQAGDRTQADIRFRKAYVLNRLFHVRKREALEAIDGLTSASPNDFESWYLKAWLELSNGKFDRGLLTLRSFRAHLDRQQKKLLERKDEAAIKAFELERRLALLRMGRLLGYIENVGADKTNETTLEEVSLTMVAGLKDQELEWFNGQRKKVANKLNDFKRQQFALKNAERLKLIEQRNNEIAQLQKQSDLLAAEAGRIEPKLDELQKQYNDRQSKLEAQASPLRSDLTRIQTSIAGMETQLNFMYNDLLVTETLAIRSRDPIVRFRLFNQADLIALSIRDQESSLAGEYNRANGASTELVILDRTMGKNRAEFQGQTSGLRTQLNGIQRTIRKNTKRIATLSKEPSIINGKLLAVENRAGALQTYDELPIESMRQKILDSVE